MMNKVRINLGSNVTECECCGRDFDLVLCSGVCPHCDYDHSPDSILACKRHNPDLPVDRDQGRSPWVDVDEVEDVDE